MVSKGIRPNYWPEMPSSISGQGVRAVEIDKRSEVSISEKG